MSVRARLLAAALGTLIGTLAASGAAPPRASEPRPMSLIDLAELSRAFDPQLSPDGRVLLYELSHADWKSDRPIWQIWRQEVGGGAPIQLTFTANGVIQGFTRWSPDGKTILFERDGQLWLMAADGGEPRALTRHATAVSFPSWTPDGTGIYFLASDPRTAAERARDQVRDDVYAYDETYKQRHLWKVTVETGGEQQVTTGDMSVVSYRLSHDGTRIACVRSPTALVGDGDQSEVWTMDASGANARAVTKNQIEEADPELSPDNRQLIWLADANDKIEPYHNTNLFVSPADAERPRVVIRNFPYAFDRATWAPDGRSILAVINMGVHSEVISIDVASGRYKLLTSGDHGIPPPPAPGAWTIEPRAGKMVFLLDEPMRYGEAWTMPLTGGTPTRITGVYDTFASTFALPKQQKFEWSGADGAAVEGVVFLPADYQPGRRYPLIVQMHGGPMESDKFGSGVGLFQSYFPVLTGKGYVVLRPNYRGSSGYGSAAYRDVVGQYFRNMHLDVMRAVDTLIAKGIADPDQLILMGWSAGGHLTNKLITVTDRFKAASSGAGASNFLSFFAQTDVRYVRKPWFGGTPWQKAAPIDAFWNNSPVKDSANVKTPTLFFVGESDPRVPLPQSIEMWRALKSNDVPTHLYVAPREGHQWGGLHHLLFKANAELEWFEKYARGRSYRWEIAPDR